MLSTPERRSFLCSLLLFSLIGTAAFAQSSNGALNHVITESEVTRVLKTLSSDAMEGRGTFTPGIDKAASFIAEEFKAAGLKPAGSNGSYLQSFTVISATLQHADATIGGKPVDARQIAVFTSSEKISIRKSDSTKVGVIGPKDDFRQTYRKIRSQPGTVLVLVDTAHRRFFNQLKAFAGPRMRGNDQQVVVLTENTAATDYSFDLHMRTEELKLANVVATIPGKSKPDEFVIFSGHYDHLGYGKADEKGDSLYNGANDDASGTTAMMMLAKYFQQVKDNERTLVFVAFTAEEVGGFGSQYFSRQYDPSKVVAMFNIEMVGTDSKWGKNSAYITGFEKTDMGSILQKNLEGTPFKFYPDPYPDQQLFYRSDNATLARLGVPAHTISTSKMDSEPYYHKASDHIETLDMQNMTEVIKAIALSSKTIVSGERTPSRVSPQQLQ